MDPVSLAVGIIGLAGLFTTCLDLVEKIDDYKDFHNDERALAAQFVSHRLRFAKWGKALGLNQAATNLSGDRHEALTDAETLETVRKIFDIVRDILSDQKGNSSPKPTVNQSRLLARSLTEPFRITPGSRRGKLAWALKGKGKREDQVELFGKLVQHLYHLVPIESITRTTTVGGNQTADPTVQIDPQPGIDNLAWTSEIRDTLQRLEGKARADTRRELHAWIVRHPPNEIYDDAIQRRLKDTCEWILERPVLNEWLSLPNGLDASRLLWINGPAGFGKTVLCARIIQHLLKEVKTPVAHFFFSSDFESREDPYEAIRVWISEIISHSQLAFDYVRVEWETQHQSVATRGFILQLFSKIVHIVPGCVFAIDGLDECTWLHKGANPARGDSISSFLKQLGRAIAGSATRILIVSRNESEIRSGVESIEGSIFEYSIIPEDVGSDTKRYSRSIVDNKLPKKSEALKNEISVKMAEKCGGQFLWLRLQKDSLRSWKNQKQLQDSIDKTPNGLDSLYDRNWVRLSQLPMEERDRAFSLLRWVTFAMRPLTVAEIAEALLISFESDELPVDELPDIIDDDYVNSEMSGICGSLLSIRKNSTETNPGLSTIRLTHFSIKQYFLSHSPSSGSTLQINEKLRSSNEKAENTILAQLCLRYIHYEQTWQFAHDQDSGQVQGSFKEYAAGYWHRHFHDSNFGDETINDLMNSLFDTNSATWEPWKKWFDSKENERMKYYINLGSDDNERQRRQEFFSQSMPYSPVYYASRLDLTQVALKLIEEHHGHLDETSYFGETALAEACQNGNEKISMVLIEAGASVSVASYDGTTPLHSTAADGHLGLVQLLLDNGAECNAVDKNSGTALHLATYEGSIDIIQLLLQNGANVMAQDFVGVTPLHIAAKYGHLPIAQLLIRQDVQTVNIMDESQQTPLHVAAINGKVEIARLILDHGASLNAADADLCTALLDAAFFGFTEMVRFLLSRNPDLDTQDRWGQTALTCAAKNGYSEVTQLLLDQGASSTLANDIGWPPLHNAAFFGSVDVVHALLTKGADITATSSTGYSPLHCAAEGGHAEIVKLLLENGVDLLAAQSNKKHTPLGVAISEGHLEVTKLLLSTGASYNAVLESEWLPLTLASFKGHIQIVQHLLSLGADLAESTADGTTPLLAAVSNNKLDMVRFLLENGADATVADNDGDTALKTSIYEGNVEIVRLLLENGIDLTIRDDQGWKPLSLASHNGHVDIIQLLLEKGSDIRATDSDGWTPLHSAADGGHTDVVDFVLHKGVQLTALDHSGKTALHIASRKGHQEIVEMLLGLSTSDDLNRADNDQRTSLFYAAMRGHSHVVKTLLSRTPKVNTEDHYGSTALISAVRNGHLEIVRQLLAVETIATESKDGFGKTILFWANKTASTQMIKLINHFISKEGPPTLDDSGSVSDQNYMPFNSEVYWCDMCTRCIPIGTKYLECSECNGGDFLGCTECVAMGAKCLNESHTWTIAAEQIAAEQ